MTTSNTFSFNPSVGEMTLYAFSRCGIRRASILREHMADAHMAANMVLADWANRGVNLWQVDLESQPLLEGVSTYDVDPAVVTILDGYISQPNGTTTIDRYILPISRTEYASYANKEQQGFPTTYWNNRQLAPTVTIWPVPPNSDWTFNYYVLKQAQDANFTNGQTADVPVVWLKAFSDALAVELAVIWAPDRLSFLSPMADKSYTMASETGIEIAQTYISPQVSGYWR